MTGAFPVGESAGFLLVEVGESAGFLLVGVGGIAGALARHLLGERIETGRRDTLAVNVLGSFLLGVLVGIPAGESLLLVAGTGFCGAFTTFSTFAFETVRLFETGQRRGAVVNAAANLTGAMLAVLMGAAFGPQLV